MKKKTPTKKNAPKPNPRAISPSTYVHWTPTHDFLNHHRPDEEEGVPGVHVPPPGVWLGLSGGVKVRVCESGLHASRSPRYALFQVPHQIIGPAGPDEGPTLHRVVLGGTHHKHHNEDKWVARFRCIVQSLPWSEVPRRIRLGIIRRKWHYFQITPKQEACLLALLKKQPRVKAPPIPRRAGPNLIILNK